MLRFLGTAAFIAVFIGLSTQSVVAKAKKGGSKMKIELYEGKDGQFRWRLKAANGAILATAGQGFKAKADAKHSIELIQKAGTDDKMKFELYEDDKKEYRWRLKAGNGQTVASSSEGYKAKADAEKAVASIKADAAKAEVVEIKE